MWTATAGAEIEGPWPPARAPLADTPAVVHVSSAFAVDLQAHPGGDRQKGSREQQN